MLKQTLIAAAAFAATVTGASAFTGGGWFTQADLGLPQNQVAALEQAQEIQQAAHTQAQQVLEAAGLDADTMRELHEKAREMQQSHREAVQTAVENNDYEAFHDAVADTPMADAIESEADFNKFVEAHNLMESGDVDAARDILSELGLERPGGAGLGEGPMGEGFGGPGFGERRQQSQ